MPCHICKDIKHDTTECTSNHARTMEDAVSNWIMNLLAHIYIKYIPDIHWISESYHLQHLSKGDLLFLNRHTIIDIEMVINQKLIYMYLHYAIWSFYQINHMVVCNKIKKIIRADISYWYRLANDVCSVEDAKTMRQIELSPPYRYIKKESTFELFDCPICLDERIGKENTHQYNCAHSVCLKCSDELLSRDHLKCPLCRTDIAVITEFTL